MYKKLPYYDNLFINTENWKLYHLHDGEMVEIGDVTADTVVICQRYRKQTDHIGLKGQR